MVLKDLIKIDQNADYETVEEATSDDLGNMTKVVCSVCNKEMLKTNIFPHSHYFHKNQKPVYKYTLPTRHR